MDDKHTQHNHGEDPHGHCHSRKSVQPVDDALLKQVSDTRSVYRILNMDCSMEEQLIRKKLVSMPAVAGLEFNLMQRVLTVDHAPGAQKSIEQALKSIDMIPEPLASSEKYALPETRIPWKKLAWAGGLAALSELLDLASHWGGQSPVIAGWPLAEILAFVLSIAAIALAGLDTYKKGWLALINFNLNINALMAVAVTGAVFLGQFPEAAMVMVLFNISEAIEAKSLDRARHAIKDLMNLAPETAETQQPDGSWTEMPVAAIKPESIVRVRPGQKIGLDGVVTSGQSAVNQAPITGESMPVEKHSGDTVFAGTINEAGSLEYRVTAGANDTTLARIIHSVEDAQASRAPIQRFVDVFAKYYTPAVFLFALLWIFIPPLFFGQSWRQSVYTALVLLVIGCPCALVIATPVTVVSGLAAATRKGILVKGGLYLEQGRRLNWLALDKTGTITSGQPCQTDFEALGPLPAREAAAIGASLADRSDHPVSRAIVAAALAIKKLAVQDFEAIPGKGVAGIINGRRYSLGSPSLARAHGCLTDALAARMEALQKQGKTVVALLGENGAEAVFAVADTARASSAEAIKELKALHVKSLMLTGDNEHTASAIAKEMGVNDFHANLMPGEKLEIIEKLQNEGAIVGMVGDGINDAPALARASIGFAMAKGGSDTAMETADVALMDDDLRKIPLFIRLSRATYAILVENIILALGIKAAFFGLTLTGYSSMWLAVLADVGAALLVVANGLRTLRK